MIFNGLKNAGKGEGIAPALIAGVYMIALVFLYRRALPRVVDVPEGLPSVLGGGQKKNGEYKRGGRKWRN